MPTFRRSFPQPPFGQQFCRSDWKWAWEKLRFFVPFQHPPGAGDNVVKDVITGIDGNTVGSGILGVRGLDGFGAHLDPAVNQRIPFPTGQAWNMQNWNSFTISAIVESDVSGGSTKDIASWWTHPGGKSWLLTHHNNGQYFFELSGKANITGGTTSTARTHIHATYSHGSGAMTLYVDGIQVAQTTGLSGTLADAGSGVLLYLGAQNNNSNHFDGRLWGISIWEREWTPAEVARHFIDPWALLEQDPTTQIFHIQAVVPTDAMPPPSIEDEPSAIELPELEETSPGVLGIGVGAVIDDMGWLSNEDDPADLELDVESEAGEDLTPPTAAVEDRLGWYQQLEELPPPRIALEESEALAEPLFQPFTDKWTVHWDGDSPLIFEPVTSGGTISLADSNAEYDSPTGGDAAFHRFAKKIDLTKYTTIEAYVKNVTGNGVPELLQLCSVGADLKPGAATGAIVNGQTMLALEMDTNGFFRYIDQSDSLDRFWDNSAESWGATKNAAFGGVRKGAAEDWYKVVIQVDGVNSRARMLAYHRSTATYTNLDQGSRTISQSDWVDFSDMDLTVTDVFFCVGNRRTDGAFTGEYRVEKENFETGTKRYVTTNFNNASGGGYSSQFSEGVECLVHPSNRGTADPAGENVRNRDWFFYGGQWVMIYEEFDGAGNGGPSRIKWATASAEGGPYTVQGDLILPGDLGTGYSQVGLGISIIIDPTTSDPSERFKMLIGVAFGDPETAWYIFALKANNPTKAFGVTGGWEVMTGSGLTDNRVLEPQGAGFESFGVAEPNVRQLADGTFEAHFSGNDGDSWQVGYMTGASDFVTWTRPGSTAIFTSVGTSSVQSFSAVSNNIVTVSDGTAYRRDAIVYIRNAASANEWHPSQIRKIDSNDLHLYHEIGGLSTADADRRISQLGDGSLASKDWEIIDGKIRFWMTDFVPFERASNEAGSGELSMLVEANSFQGPFTILDGPAHTPHLHDWGAKSSNENPKIRSEEIATDPGDTSWLLPLDELEVDLLAPDDQELVSYVPRIDVVAGERGEWNVQFDDAPLELLGPDENELIAYTQHVVVVPAVERGEWNVRPDDAPFELLGPDDNELISYVPDIPVAAVTLETIFAKLCKMEKALQVVEWKVLDELK